MADNAEFEATEETENVENDSPGDDNDFSDEENIFEVDRIIGMMTHEGKTLYKVRWQGYGPEEDTWEPRDNLLSCEDLIDEYVDKVNARKRKNKQTLQMKRACTDESDDRSSGTVTPSQESQDSEEKQTDDNNKDKQDEKGKVGKESNNSDEEIDTLKDTFWRDLEQGLINLEGDMYSKVKGRRAALDAKKRQREKEEEEKIKQRKKRPGRRPGMGKTDNKEKADKETPSPVKRKKKLKKKLGAALEVFETLENATSRALDMSMISPDPSSSQPTSSGSGSYAAAEEVVTVAKLERYHSSSLLSSTDDDDVSQDALNQENEDSCHFLDGTTSNSRPPGLGTGTEKTKYSDKDETLTIDGNKKSAKNKTYIGGTDSCDSVVAKQQNIKDTSISDTDRQDSLFRRFEQRGDTSNDDSNTCANIVEFQKTSKPEESVLASNTSSSIKVGRKPSEVTMETIDSESSETTRKRRLSNEDAMSVRKRKTTKDEQSQREGDKTKLDITEKKLKSALKKTEHSTVEDWRKPNDQRQDRNGNKENQKTKSSVSADSDIECSSLMEFDLDDYDPDDNEEPVHDLPSDVTQEMFGQAIKDGNHNLVRHALNSKRQYNVMECDAAGMTLVMVCCTGQHDEVLKLLVTNGAPVNAKQKNGTTALMIAAENGYNSTVAILLEAGAHVNQQQSTGETALMKACKKGHKVIVRLLLENGADPNITSTHGNNAQQYAKMYSQTTVGDTLVTHNTRVSKAVESTVLRYLAGCARILKPLFPTRIFPICETTDQTVTFSIKSPQMLQQQGVGTLLFLIHSGFYGQNINCKLTGPCCIKDVLLNNVPQQQVVQGSNFVISLCTKPGVNLLHIKTVPTAHSTCKLLVCGYILQLTSQT